MKKPPLSPETLKKYLANECSDEERRLVNEWYQQLDEPADEPFTDADQDRLYNRIKTYLSELRKSDEPATPVYGLWHYIGRIAAVFVVGLGLLYFLYQRQEEIAQQTAQPDGDVLTFVNEEHKILPHLLPDSTVVWLHPGAKISHDHPFIVREVLFSGEGFFEVKRDPSRPFVIHTGDLQTKVLGTSFNVRAIPGEGTVKVSVATGRVEVGNAQMKERVVLRPEQEVVFEPKSKHLEVLKVAEKDSDKELWQSASLVFNETPMKEVAERLMQTFHVKIGFADDGLADCRLKVDFTDQRLPEILDMIDTLLGSTYRMEGETITLKGQGCR
ncbi:ferric-dicitrate binding protein FerR (iron transport regulator) [Dyadobacter sp. BE34]|uniref:Ferric-dicitrate binding protein FerR (Iron transport regulator) n=1 Tax=Dyadobacter fermentans TaxID=94254 RepID=A0ABU1QVW9_9BACT|nr:MULTISPECIES: FecR domain-containing protein [Dyadobacter]MDR6805290.1 ferric-dicitrate binding protein FerR (iron transport regulator) [Dyadobacter fermentans]MDR7042950.1 ferric-dicitrate binding protein FerR (iron transport regulator) [Dyadobacter sp. BE242]MDR7197262.1 ferric-dicitrate binding protein FerR (iron transport regulator) [Dyadobacter sp. BE34]MDR7215303.1 ferric-dicitrate binding protein FerR (iron transport regulator) [Dyadobacter sp. BE31]MDR7262839.1 ferric-dicitrate bind